MFSGHGTDEDGIVTAYKWRSSIDGGLGEIASISLATLSPGSHTIYFKVRDNAGQWSQEASRAFTVVSGNFELPIIHEFSITPAEIPAGDRATLKWNVSKAAVINIDQNIGTVAGTGQKSLTPSVTTIYTLTAKNSSGIISKYIEVKVKGSPVINSFSSSASTITLGDKSLLSWDVSDSFDISITPDIGAVPGKKGTIAISPTSTTKYVITAANTLGSSTKEIEIIVTSDAQQIYKLEETAVLTASGTIRQDGTVDPKNQWVGDDDFNKGMQVFLSFDISELPNNAVIRSARIDLTNASVQIRPFTLGKLRVYNDQYGLLDSSDFTSSFPDGVENGLLFTFTSIPSTIFALPQYSRNQLQSMANEGVNLYQIRLQFEKYTNEDNEWDFVRFTETTPRLIVEYISK